MPSGLRSVLWSLAVAAVVALCAGIVASADAKLAGAISKPNAAEVIYLPPTRFLRAVSLGYEHTLADVLWFRTINYFGDHFWADRSYPWLAYMCDVVTDLDPRAEHVYEFGGVMLPWVADRADDGLALLEKGVHNVPDSWRLRYLLGFNYYYFKDDLPAATRAFESAMRLPDTPEFVSRMAATIAAAQQGTDDAIAFLIELQRNTPNDQMRGALRERILELVLTRDSDALDAAVAAFEARLGRKPADLGELVSNGIVAAIPADPFGGQYVLDAENGKVRSSTGHEPRRLQRSTLRERFLKRGDVGGAP